MPVPGSGLSMLTILFYTFLSFFVSGLYMGPAYRPEFRVIEMLIFDNKLNEI